MWPEALEGECGVVSMEHVDRSMEMGSEEFFSGSLLSIFLSNDLISHISMEK